MTDWKLAELRFPSILNMLLWEKHTGFHYCFAGCCVFYLMIKCQGVMLRISCCENEHLNRIRNGNLWIMHYECCFNNRFAKLNVKLGNSYAKLTESHLRYSLALTSGSFYDCNTNLIYCLKDLFQNLTSNKIFLKIFAYHTGFVDI